jgi:hypothetical protein
MKRVIFLVVGILLLLLASYRYGKQNEFIKTAEKAEGIVVDNQTKLSSKRKRSFAPIVEFISKDNKKIRFVSSVSSNSPSYNVGEKVNVYYDPMTPQNAQIDSFLERWGVTAMAGFSAVVFILIGVPGIFAFFRTS